MRRSLVLIAVLTVSLAACSSSSKSGDATTTSRPTAAATTTTTAPALSTTSAPSTTIPTVVTESAFVDSVDGRAHTITIDPMEFLTGPAATAAFHQANPGAAEGPPNDYFIVNPNKDHVVMPLASTTRVQLVLVNGTPENPPVDSTLAALSTYSGLGHSPFWITIDHGQVTEVMEQFVP